MPTLPTVEIPFFVHFFRTGSYDLATGSDDLLGWIGFHLVVKPILRKKGGNPNTFPVPEGIIMVLLPSRSGVGC